MQLPTLHRPWSLKQAVWPLRLPTSFQNLSKTRSAFITNHCLLLDRSSHLCSARPLANHRLIHQTRSTFQLLLMHRARHLWIRSTVMANLERKCSIPVHQVRRIWTPTPPCCYIFASWPFWCAAASADVLLSHFHKQAITRSTPVSTSRSSIRPAFFSKRSYIEAKEPQSKNLSRRMRKSSY